MREFSPSVIQRSVPAAREDMGVLNRPACLEEEGLTLQRYWWVLRKHLWLITGFFLSTVLATVVVIVLLTPFYTAETTLLIEPNPPQVLNMREVLASPSPLATDDQGFYRSFYETQYEILRSRALAAQVIQEQGLEQSHSFTEKVTKKRNDQLASETHNGK